MTDGEIVKVMDRIRRLTEEVNYLIDEEVLNHRNGEALRGELHDNGFGHTWACAKITHSHLNHPDRWECIGGNLKYKSRGRGGR